MLHIIESMCSQINNDIFFRNFGSNGNQNNLSSVVTSIEYSLADINSNVDSRQYVFKELSPKSGNSGRAVSQILLPSSEFQERSR